MLPLSLYLQQNNLMLQAIEDGSFGPGKLAEIEQTMSALTKHVLQREQDRSASASNASR